MQKNQTKLSYLVSTYNSGHFLDRHIADLLERQTDSDFEIIIVNPASPGTDELIAKKWEAVDSRIVYAYWPQRETYGESWLRAWQLARGEFVINSNTDDFHAPESTSEFYKNMKFATSKLYSGPKIGFGYAGLQVVDEHGKILGGGIKPKFDYEQYTHACNGGPQLCWRNDSEFKYNLDWDLLHEMANQYDSAFDYAMILYFMSLGYHGHVIPKILTIYTQRKDSIENSNKWKNNYQTYSAISRFFAHNFTTNLKHAKEFADFNNLPPKDEWISTMQSGKKWK